MIYIEQHCVGVSSKFSLEMKIIFNHDTCPPRTPKKKFYQLGTFSTLAPHCPPLPPRPTNPPIPPPKKSSAACIETQ